MAIYRFEAKVISRGGGRSTVASASYRTGKCVTSAAAYRAGTKLTDERTGQSFDYSKKEGVLGAEIMVPHDAPAWMAERSKLWNAVEACEKRKDAQLAKDFVIALPHEMTHDQRVALTREFVREQFTDKGFVADVAWHAPSREDSLNVHAHVMVTMRKVDGDGFSRFKERPPANDHPQKHWKQELAGLRQAWADTANKHLEAAGLEARIDPRSLEAQGIDREPEPKLGPIAAQIEAAGQESLAGNDRRAALARNAERAQLTDELARSAAEEAKIIDLMAYRDRGANADLRADERGRTSSEEARGDDETKFKRRAGGDLEWTDQGGMIEQQRSAMDWVQKAHEEKNARTERTDRKQETRDADQMREQHHQHLMRKYGGDASPEMDHERDLGGRER